MNSLYPNMPTEDILDHRNNIDFPIMGVQTFAAFVTIYLIMVLV
jgi:hypothetical protein